jgi:hypothetical protein
MKKTFLIASLLSVAMFVLAACDTAGDDDDNSNNTNNKPEETDDPVRAFYNKFPFANVSAMDYYTKQEYYDRMRELIPAGIYIWVNDEGVEIAFCKGTDGSLSLYEIASMQEKSAFIGSNLYVKCRAEDGKCSSYWLYNDHFGKSLDYKPAPSVHHFEYLTREEMFDSDPIHEDNLSKLSFAMFNHFAQHSYLERYFRSKWDPQEYEIESEKEDVLGIPCTHYTLKQKTDAGLSEPLIQYWLTDQYVCIKMLEGGNYSEHTLLNILPAGTLEENYNTMAKQFSVYPDIKWEELLHSHTKYSNEWLTNEYPASLHPFGLIRYTGEISSFEVNRRAWKGYDNIISIVFTSKVATIDDARAYIQQVKNLPLSNTNEDKETIEDDYIFISYEGSNLDVADPNLGETVCYPDYEISFRKFSGEYPLQEFSVHFDVARLTGL